MFRKLTRLAIVLVAVAGLMAFLPAGTATASGAAVERLNTSTVSSDTVASPHGGEVGVQAYSDCKKWQFCAWDDYNGNGYPDLIWGGTIPCGGYWDLRGTSMQDKISSIQNNTSGTVQLQNWGTDGKWYPVWDSVKGNWGNLPASAQDNTDRLRFICT